MDYKVTKITKVFEVSNSMAHNVYYLVNVRFTDSHYMRRMKFVLWDDFNDICDYFEKDRVSKANIKEYMYDRAYSTISAYFGWLYNDTSELSMHLKQFKEFREFCNQTIEDYNR